MTEEEKKAIENVKNMFEGITIKSLNKDSKMTIYSLGIADILLFINAFDKQQEETEELNAENAKLIKQRTEGFLENERLIEEIQRQAEIIKSFENREMIMGVKNV